DNAFLNRADLLLGVEAELVEDPGLQGLRRILPPAEQAVIEAMSEVPLGAFRDLVGIRRDRLDRLFADDDVVPLKEHYAGSDLVPFRVDQRLRAAQVVEAGDDRKRGSQVDA